MSHGRDVRISNRRNGERGTSAAGSGVGREESGEPVQQAAVLGERRAGNQCNGQRCWERGERGTSATGSGARRIGSGKNWKGVTEPCGIVSSMLFLSFVLNFYFLKKTTTATFLVLSSSDYQYDEYHQYH